jgi:hypothetical protein
MLSLVDIFKQIVALKEIYLTNTTVSNFNKCKYQFYGTFCYYLSVSLLVYWSVGLFCLIVCLSVCLINAIQTCLRVTFNKGSHAQIVSRFCREVRNVGLKNTSSYLI